MMDIEVSLNSAQSNSCQMNVPLLTIAIPTYNRSVHLETCLGRILEEIDALPQERRSLVCVYVSDNCSPDDTPDVIQRYQRLIEAPFRSVRNESNIGADRNVAQCYASAETPYAWVLGDDDLVVPGGLEKVLAVLEKQDVDVLYVSHYWFMNHHTESVPSNGRRGVTRFASPVLFTRRTNVMLTFISALIARTGANVEGYADVLHGSNLPQLGWLLQLIRDGRSFAVIEDMVVAAKGSNSGGYGLVQVFGHNLKRITERVLKGHPEIARALENGTIVNFFPGFVADFRSGGNLFEDNEMAQGLKEVFGGNWRYHLFIAPLFWVPPAFCGHFRLMLRVVGRLFRSVLI